MYRRERPTLHAGTSGKASGRETIRDVLVALVVIASKRSAFRQAEIRNEFLRLREARQASNGSIEYKVMWKPTWVAFEHLREERALEEAEELTVNEFGKVTWETELRTSGHLDIDTETE